MTRKRTLYLPENSSSLIEKFINCLMNDGNKSIARIIFNKTMNLLVEQGEKYPEKMFEKAVETIKPHVEVRPKRIGGAVYQIPVEVKTKRQQTLAIRWIINAAQSRKGRPMAERLADEIKEAVKEQGTAYKKKMDVFRMAQANKAFAHFARY